MKKTVYTIAFIALFSVVSNAQTEKNQKETPAKQENVNSDGTLKPDATLAPVAAPANSQAADSKQPEAETKKGGTRMAITEKGVPASKKPEETKKAEPAKAEKH